MGENGARFVLREQLASIGDDYWIEDDGGNNVYRVDGKVFRVGKKAILEDADGRELYTIHHKMAHAHRTFEITRDGERAAEVQRNMIGIHHKFKVEVEGGQQMEVKGDFVSHKFSIHAGHRHVAEATHKWLSVRDAFGIEVFDQTEAPLVMAIVIAVELSELIDLDDNVG